MNNIRLKRRNPGAMQEWRHMMVNATINGRFNNETVVIWSNNGPHTFTNDGEGIIRYVDEVANWPKDITEEDVKRFVGSLKR